MNVKLQSNSAESFWHCKPPTMRVNLLVAALKRKTCSCWRGGSRLHLVRQIHISIFTHVPVPYDFPESSKRKIENCYCTFAETETSLLVIVVDVNPAQRILVEETHKLTHCLDAIVAFTNCHLMLRTTNKLAVLACNADGRLVDNCVAK